MIHLISQFSVQYTGCSAMCFIKSLHYCHTVQRSCLTCWIYTLLIIQCCRKGFRRMSPPCVLYNHCMLHVNSLFTKGPYDFQLTTSQFRHVTPGVVLYNGSTWSVPVIDLIKKNLPNLSPDGLFVSAGMCYENLSAMPWTANVIEFPETPLLSALAWN